MAIRDLCSVGALSLVLAIAPAARGQDEVSEAADPIPAEPFDEITVYGEKSIIQLRKEFEVAQVRMFDIFNTLNSTDEFDVECERVQRTNSRRSDQLCTPKFALRPTAHSGAGILVWDDRKGTATMISHRTYQLNQRMWSEMAELVKANSELQEAFVELAAARNALESERQRRGED